MRGKAEGSPYSLKDTSASWGNTKQEVGKCPERGISVTNLTLSCFLQTLSCHTNATVVAILIGQKHGSGVMQRLPSAVSLIEMSSSPARTSLTPTLTMTKGRISPWASTEQAKSPQTLYEVSWVAETLVQQQLKHCSLRANKTRECASNLSYTGDSQVHQSSVEHNSADNGAEEPIRHFTTCLGAEALRAEDIFRIPASRVAAVPGNAPSCASV